MAERNVFQVTGPRLDGYPCSHFCTRVLQQSVTCKMDICVEFLQQLQTHHTHLEHATLFNSLCDKGFKLKCKCKLFPKRSDSINHSVSLSTPPSEDVQFCQSRHFVCNKKYKYIRCNAYKQSNLISGRCFPSVILTPPPQDLVS